MDRIDHFKQRIRKQILLKRNSLDEITFTKANNKICENLLKILTQIINNYSIYGMYLPMKGEPDILKTGLNLNKVMALPKIIDNEMIFVKYQIGDPLEISSFSKLTHPKSVSEITPTIIIVPGLSFSVKGDRIGFGFGHYDKYLYKLKQFCQPVTIGICFHENLQTYLPTNQYDEKMNYIITDQIILKI